jgi:hypothetical protein
MKTREKERELIQALRDSGTFRRAAIKILEKAANQTVGIPSGLLPQDGIASVSMIEKIEFQEEDIDALKDHPGQSCDNAHAGMSHDDWMKSEEESRYPGPRPVYKPRLRRSALEKMLTGEERISGDISGRSAASRVWMRVNADLLQPAARIKRAEERKRRQIINDGER